jgi:hypothetical protein
MAGAGRSADAGSLDVYRWTLLPRSLPGVVAGITWPIISVWHGDFFAARGFGRHGPKQMRCLFLYVDDGEPSGTRPFQAGTQLRVLPL